MSGLMGSLLAGRQELSPLIAQARGVMFAAFRPFMGGHGDVSLLPQPQDWEVPAVPLASSVLSIFSFSLFKATFQLLLEEKHLF